LDLQLHCSHTPIHEDVKQSQQSSEGNTSKTQLIEALCHSQTRAREAEEAAKQAYAEKEHIIALIFKQASQLFAYKQLIKLLQLETLCNQIKNNDQSTSTLFPWMSYEHRKSRKRKQTYSNGRRDREGKSNCDITTYAVAIALGLSLVGAGLLLGWTVGWMSPCS
jgi:thymidylate kinase